MWRRCCKGSRFPTGPVLIALGIGIMIAYIIPYYVLIFLLAAAFVVAGWRIIRKK